MVTFIGTKEEVMDFIIDKWQDGSLEVWRREEAAKVTPEEKSMGQITASKVAAVAPVAAITEGRYEFVSCDILMKLSQLFKSCSTPDGVGLASRLCARIIKEFAGKILELVVLHVYNLN